MSNKTFWLSTLGAAFCVVIGLSVYKAQEQRGEVASPASPAAAGGEPEPRPAAGPAGESSPQGQDPVVAPGGNESNGISDEQVQVLLPHQVAATPMAQALADLATSPPPGIALDDLPMSPPPEMLAGERDFAAEGVDPQWATATEADILGKIAQINGLTVVDLRVECRTTMCRVQLVEPRRTTPESPYGSFPDLVETFGLAPRWVISVVNRSGTLTSIAYLSRGEPAVTPSDAP
jgi:hypothetical protein